MKRQEASAWFRRMHLEAPTPDRLTHVIRSAAHSFEQQLYDGTLARLPEATQAALEALLSTETEIAALQEVSAVEQPRAQGVPEELAANPTKDTEEEIFANSSSLTTYFRGWRRKCWRSIATVRVLKNPLGCAPIRKPSA